MNIRVMILITIFLSGQLLKGMEADKDAVAHIAQCKKDAWLLTKGFLLLSEPRTVQELGTDKRTRRLYKWAWQGVYDLILLGQVKVKNPSYSLLEQRSSQQLFHDYIYDDVLKDPKTYAQVHNVLLDKLVRNKKPLSREEIERLMSRSFRRVVFKRHKDNPYAPNSLHMQEMTKKMKVAELLIAKKQRGLARISHYEASQKVPSLGELEQYIAQ